MTQTQLTLFPADYETRAYVLPAAAVGAPHQRMRTFIVANSDSKRWDCLEKGQANRRHRQHSESDASQGRQEKIWSTAVHVLSTGAEILSQPGGRLRRNDDGLSSGMDRLKCVGNAVMPQQILPIFRAIVEIEKGR